MATTTPVATSNAIVDAWGDLFDVGSTNATAQLVLQTTIDGEVATLNCSNPAMLAATSRIATSDTITSDTTATGGTVDNVIVWDRDQTERVRATSVTVPAGGGDFEITSLSVTAGDTVECTAGFTLTGPN